MNTSPFVYHKILNATTFLVNKEGLNKLTVKSITECAGISRQTYYMHFTDKYGAVNAVFLRDFMSLIEKYQANTDMTLIDGILIWLTILLNNKDFYNCSLAVMGPNSLFNFMVDISCKFTELAKCVCTSDAKTKTTIRLSQYGVCSLIAYWIQHSDHLTKEEFAHYINGFIPDKIIVHKDDIASFNITDLRYSLLL